MGLFSRSIKTHALKRASDLFHAGQHPTFRLCLAAAAHDEHCSRERFAAMVVSYARLLREAKELGYQLDMSRVGLCVL